MFDIEEYRDLKLYVKGHLYSANLCTVGTSLNPTDSTRSYLIAADSMDLS